MKKYIVREEYNQREQRTDGMNGTVYYGKDGSNGAEVNDAIGWQRKKYADDFRAHLQEWHKKYSEEWTITCEVIEVEA